VNAFVFKNYKGVIVSEKGLNSGIHLMAYFHQVKVLYSRTLKKKYYHSLFRYILWVSSLFCPNRPLFTTLNIVEASTFA
jgi:hypothetical protein